MGILGGISILTGIVLFASQTTSLIAIVLFVFGSAIAVGITDSISYLAHCARQAGI